MDTRIPECQNPQLMLIAHQHSGIDQRRIFCSGGWLRNWVLMLYDWWVYITNAVPVTTPFASFGCLLSSVLHKPCQVGSPEWEILSHPERFWCSGTNPWCVSFYRAALMSFCRKMQNGSVRICEDDASTTGVFYGEFRFAVLTGNTTWKTLRGVDID